MTVRAALAALVAAGIAAACGGGEECSDTAPTGQVIVEMGIDCADLRVTVGDPATGLPVTYRSVANTSGRCEFTGSLPPGALFIRVTDVRQQRDWDGTIPAARDRCGGPTFRATFSNASGTLKMSYTVI